MHCGCVIKSDTSTGLDVTDLIGRFVLRVAIDATGSGGTKGITLQTGPGNVIARCYPAPDAKQEYHVARGNGDYFATFVLDDAADGYRLHTVDGVSLNFWAILTT